jgi:hypothetical protein
MNNMDNIGSNLVLNNTFPSASGNCHLTGVTAMYNIFADGQVTTSNTVPAIFMENIFADLTLPAQADPNNGNIDSVDMATVFVDIAATPLDKAYSELLAAPNPATINCMGGGGTGCGATMGANPHYVLSGIPEIPILYHLTADNFPDGGGNINVTVKAKSY